MKGEDCMLLLHPYSLVDTWIDAVLTPCLGHGMDTVPPSIYCTFADHLMPDFTYWPWTVSCSKC